ncbi:ABC transporter transmembrane region family protein [Mycobacterium xenopi 3993]|nr:ABC transporter transmembrane region family protein [Mycobacterium xenopi 3993]
MQKLIDGVNRVMRDQLSGVRVVRAFTREQFERDRFAQANLALSNTALAAGNWQALMLPVTTLTINCSSVALIWFGGLRIDHGQMQVGSLVAFLSYFMQILIAVLMATMLLMMLPRPRCVPSGSPRCCRRASPSEIPGAAVSGRRCDRSGATGQRHIQLSGR